MLGRGTYNFEVQANGNLTNNPENVERTRKLFRDGSIISGNWGPGRDRNDFVYGSWHILCHLAAGIGVYKSGDEYIWMGLLHRSYEGYDNADLYEATLYTQQPPGWLSLSARSTFLDQAVLLGYIEETSRGHILARNARDTREAYNGWLRQDYNQAIGSRRSGGVVWELWCPTRDLRATDQVDNSVLKAFVELVSVLGGEFVAAVARGRREHRHPIYLCALVKAGFITREEALWDTKPYEIPRNEDLLFQEAKPSDSLKAAQSLTWTPSRGKRYYMFRRKIGSWSNTRQVESDLNSFR